MAARQWLASLVIPTNTRAAASATFDAVGENDFRAAGKCLGLLVETCGPNLDPASTAELTELLEELAAASQARS